ncbi:MAG: TldD/PmbA family protein [Eubacteriales bacterium]|nr:TldD/PmbA family protein [Eubacteriales bacterium]
MQILNDTVALALEAFSGLGAQIYSARAVKSRRNEFNVDGGRFSLFRTTLDTALTLQAIKDHKRGVVSGNSFDEKAVRMAAADCLASAEAGQADPAWDMAESGGGTFEEGPYEPDMDKLFARTREMLEAIKKEYPKIMVEQLIVSHVQADSVYENSKGVRYTAKSGRYEADIMFSGHEGDKSSSFNGGGFRTASLEEPFLELGSLRKLLEDAQNQIHTTPAPGKGEGAVVFTPECLGSILYELAGNYVSDAVLIDGTSQWKDKLGQQVADPALTLRLAPGDERIVSGEKYTEEGYRSEDFALIEKGVLKQFLLSDYAARKTGHTRAPNTSYALVVEPGEKPLQDIIASIKKGLLVGRYSGGAAGANGEFSGVAKNAFMIEDGKVTFAVSETMIAGNLAGMLNQLIGISKETVQDGTSVLPWLAVNGITISGQ